MIASASAINASEVKNGDINITKDEEDKKDVEMKEPEESQ